MNVRPVELVLAPHIVDDAERLAPRRTTSAAPSPSARSRAPSRPVGPAAACRRCPAARRARPRAGRSCRASLRAIRMSAASATSSPPPTVCPFSAAMTSFGVCSSRSQRLVRVQAEVVLELRVRVLEHPDVRAGAEELVARAAQDDHVDAGSIRALRIAASISCIIS